MTQLTKEERHRSDLLKQVIFKEIEKAGRIPFVRFMELALYHPEHGYYSSTGQRIGKEGDYYTSPHVHPVFGRLVGKQIHEMWRILGEPDPLSLVELGPGTGWLAHDLLEELQRNHPDCFERTRYGLVERSPAMVLQQKERLRRFVEKGMIHWMEEDEIAKSREKAVGCVLSNEFFDALPFHRVAFENGRLWEIHVTRKGDAFQEVLAPPSHSWIEAYLAGPGISLQEGQRAEIHLNALQWLALVAGHLERGFILTIDFGWKAEDLYSTGRPDGTLLCYFRHGASTDPYERVGLQDITAHVNFSALMDFGRAIGLETTGFVPQYRFLLSLGLINEMASLEEGIADVHSPLEKRRLLLEKSAMRRLTVPDELGYGFKVLIQHKGVRDPLLRGFGTIPSLHWQGKTWG